MHYMGENHKDKNHPESNLKIFGAELNMDGILARIVSSAIFPNQKRDGFQLYDCNNNLGVVLYKHALHDFHAKTGDRNNKLCC